MFLIIGYYFLALHRLVSVSSISTGGFWSINIYNYGALDVLDNGLILITAGIFLFVWPIVLLILFLLSSELWELFCGDIFKVYVKNLGLLF